VPPKYHGAHGSPSARRRPPRAAGSGSEELPRTSPQESLVRQKKSGADGETGVFVGLS
jgi:hypothetical protein